MLRIGKRVEDMKDELEKIGIQIVDMRKFWNSYFIQTHVHSILLEGAQGFELDINWTNNYPYCTSSTCTLAGAINTGISMANIRNIIGVSKIYDTYVGTMKFQLEEDEDLIKIGDLGMEYGSTTGRRRQCNYLNLDNLVEALQINQCTHCIINKVDIVQELNIYKLYHVDTLIRFDTWEDMKNHIVKTLQNVEVIFSSNPYEI
jgi:adenylosuccinate synthase